MNAQPGDPSRLSGTQRRDRFQALREATAQREPPVITEAGLRLIRDLAATPQPAEPADGQLHPELEQLAQAGLADASGNMHAGGKAFLDTVRWSNAHLEIEVAAGQSVRAWKSWLGQEHAVVLAQSSPAIAPGNTPHDVAGRQPLTLSHYTLQLVTPGWVPVDALHWLGSRPQTPPGHPCQLPLSPLLRRVTDPAVPPPRDDPDITRLWDQPLQMWAVTAEPAGDHLLLLDSAATGVWMLATGSEGTRGARPTDGTGTVTLTPLPARALWRLLLVLTVRAVSPPGARPADASSDTSPSPGGSRSP
ncbi:MAG: hypothetical protein LBI49_18795 [Nocardiopsaceae bacterium]|nr:hypothetical protein [Nocardiopsaceae bacterium]